MRGVTTLGACLLFAGMGAMGSLHAQHVYMRKASALGGIQAHEVYNIFQDRNRYLWFASDGGVWRFDGRTYRNFTTVDGLPGNTIFGFSEDRHGRLWLQSYTNRLAYIHNEQVVELPCSDSLAARARGAIASSLYVDSQDTVFLAFLNWSWYVAVGPPYGPKDMHFRQNPRGEYPFVLELEPGGLLVGGPQSYTPDSALQLSFVQPGKSQLLDLHVHDRTANRPNDSRQPDGSRMIGFFNNVFHFAAGRLAHVRTMEHTVLRALHDSRGNLWVATTAGLFLFRQGQKNPKPEVYFKGDFATCILEDHEGAYWVSTLNAGFAYIPHPDLQFWSKHSGFQDKVFATYYDEATQTAYVADGEGYLNLIRGDSLVDRVSISPVAGRPNRIELAFQIGPDALLFCGQQVFVWNTRTRQPRFLREGDNFRSGRVGCRVGTHTVVARYNALDCYYPVQDCVVEMSVLKHRINAIHAWKENLVLVSTEGGVTAFDIEGKNGWELLESENLLSVVAVLPWQGLDTQVVVMKTGSLVWADLAAGRVLLRHHTLEGVTVRQAQLDHRGRIWLATNHGVFQLDRDLRLTTIDQAHGLPTDLIDHIAFGEGKAFLSTPQGLIVFPAEKSFFNPQPPVLHFTGVFASGEEIRRSGTITLPHNQNFVEVRYEGLEFRSQGALRYQYRMNGLEEGWRETTSNRVEYTTLPPGEYQFELYALNQDGVRSTATIRMGFVILPPIWQRWWFIVSCGLGGLGVMLTIFRLRLRQVKRREAEKNAQAQRLIQAEMQALRSQMNPHFIFNSLNSIQHHILSGEPLMAQKYLAKFSKLIRNVLEHSRQEQITLAEELESLRLYLDLEALRLEERFSYTIAVAADLNPMDCRLPPLIVQPFVENAIWHGLAQMPGEGHVSIRAFRENGALQLEVEDNGIGRAAALQSGEGTLPKASLGMKITTGRLNLLRAHGLVPLVEVVDKLDQAGRPTGTKVIIQIPMEPAYDVQSSHR